MMLKNDSILINLGDLKVYLHDYLSLLKVAYEDESIEMAHIDTRNDQFIKICYYSRADKFMECFSLETETDMYAEDEERPFSVDITDIYYRAESLKCKLAYNEIHLKRLNEVEEALINLRSEEEDLLYTRQLLEDFNLLLSKAEQIGELDADLMGQLDKQYGLLLMFLDEKNDYFRSLEDRFNRLGLC